MTYQLVAKKLEDGTFKLAVVANGEFQDAASSAKLETYVTDELAVIALSMRTGERVTIGITTSSENQKEK